MLITKQPAAWEPSYLPQADGRQALGQMPEVAVSSPTLAIGLLFVLALASAVQAVLDPELLGEIFMRL